MNRLTLWSQDRDGSDAVLHVNTRPDGLQIEVEGQQGLGRILLDDEDARRLLRAIGADDVAWLQQRRREMLAALRACTESDADYWRWQGHAELSRQMLERLGAEVPR
jgi:hypothetical protein